MALSDADFYAFSRATGTPVVEDPEAKARIAPQVAEWRRNQLKSPETKQAESSNLLQNLGLGAAVAGLGALGVAALGRRGGVRMANVGRAAAQGVQEVDFEDLGNVYRAAGRTQPPPSRPAPSRPAPTPASAPTPPPRPATSRRGGVQLADLGQITGTEPRGLLRGREPGGEITRTSRQVGIVPAEITEVAVADITPTAATRQLPGTKDFIAGYFQKTGTPAGYLTEAVTEATPIVAVEQVKPESLVTKQQNAQAFLNDQVANAIDVAEDQMTGRVKSQLQRNEDLDMSQVDLLEEMAEQSRIQGMEQDEPINQVAAALADGLPIDQAEEAGNLSSQQLANIAKAEMISRRQELIERGLRPGTTRFERALAEGWAAKPGLVPGSSEFNKQIALPTNIRQAVEAVSADPLDPMGALKERALLNIGPLAQVTKTAAGTAIRGASPSYHEALPKTSLRQLYGEPDVLVPGAPDELVPDIPAALRLRGGPIPEIEEGGPGLSKQEIVYSELDRPQVQMPKAGSAGIGVYGVEPGYVPGAVTKSTGEYSAASQRKPTYVSSWVQKQEMPVRTGFENVSSESINRMLQETGAKGLSVNQSRIAQETLNQREIAKQSMEVSEALRRAKIEGRSPQQFLKNFQIGG